MYSSLQVYNLCSKIKASN